MSTVTAGVGVPASARCIEGGCLEIDISRMGMLGIVRIVRANAGTVPGNR